jgi:hypothetical protein
MLVIVFPRDKQTPLRALKAWTDPVISLESVLSKSPGSVASGDASWFLLSNRGFKVESGLKGGDDICIQRGSFAVPGPLCSRPRSYLGLTGFPNLKPTPSCGHARISSEH